jgi:hypothetical protein
VKNILGKYNEEIELVGLLRDSYNHVAALVYKSEEGGNVAVPVIEDGISYAYHQDVPERMGGEERPQLTLVLNVKIIFDWDDFKPAPLNEVVRFYKKYVEPHFPELYTVQRSIKSAATRKIEAVQLKNGLYVPVTEDVQAPPNFPDRESPRTIEEMEWKINKDIVIESTKSLKDLHALEEINTKDFTESFEHLRITFSKWINSVRDGGHFRRILQSTIVDKRLPLYEKRKRLEIMLGSTVERWITDEDLEAPKQHSLLRVDCIGRKKDECGNTCKWVEKGGEEAGGKCLIHVRKRETAKEEGNMSAARVMLFRLIDELIRFGNRRREIFEQRVSQLAIIDDPIRMGDQYIIPEKSMAWTEMLRTEWSKTTEETPVYLEEMRRDSTESDKKPLPPITEDTALPKVMETLLGDSDPLTARLRLLPSRTGTFAPFMTFFNTTAEAIGLSPDATELTDEIITKLVKKARLPIVQYDIRSEPPVITGKQVMRDQDIGYVIFVLGEKGPSMVVTDTEAPEFLKRSELPREFVELLKGKTLKRIFTVV